MNFRFGPTLFVAWFIAASTPALFAQSIFPDKVLESAVRRQVFAKRNNDEPLTAKDVEKVATIELKGHTFNLDGKRVERPEKIKDLTGLEHCHSLALLDLEGHEITDVSQLRGLTNLQSLNLANNKITDVAPLEPLVRLQLLDLSGNQVTDLAPLSQLTNMRSLYLSGNAVTDLAPLKTLTKAWSLYLDHNKVTDVEPLRALTSLKSLDLRNNSLTDISPLADLKEWDFLFLDNNKLTDISKLVEMAKRDREGDNNFALFWKVYLDGNPLSDQAKKQQLEELRKHSSPNRIHFR